MSKIRGRAAVAAAVATAGLAPLAVTSTAQAATPVYSPAQLNDVSLCGSFPSYRNPVEVRVQAPSGGLDLKYVGPLGHFAATINNMPANGELALVWVYCTPGARPTRGSYVQLHTGLNVFSV